MLVYFSSAWNGFSSRRHRTGRLLPHTGPNGTKREPFHTIRHFARVYIRARFGLFRSCTRQKTPGRKRSECAPCGSASTFGGSIELGCHIRSTASYDSTDADHSALVPSIDSIAPPTEWLIIHSPCRCYSKPFAFNKYSGLYISFNSGNLLGCMHPTQTIQIKQFLKNEKF